MTHCPSLSAAVAVSVCLRLDAAELEVALRVAAEEGVEVADELVDVALARRLDDDLLVVVVAQAAGQLLVVHLGLVLALAPTPRHLIRNRQGN